MKSHHYMTARRPSIRAVLMSLVVAGIMPGLANAASSCSVTANTGISFAYSPIAQSGTTSSGSIQVSCTGLGSGIGFYTVALSAGRGTFVTRKMTDGAGDALTYNLYQNASDTLVWGDGSGSTLPFTGIYSPGNGTSIFTYYGLISPASQNIPGGTYADSPTITVNF